MVDVIGRAKIIVESTVDQSSLDKSSGKIGSALKVGATAGVAALGTLAVAGVKAVKSFQEGEAASRKLSNVLGNMGKGGAAEEVEKLASSLQRTTGVSDDTIKSGQTLLATFSEVASSAGETGGVFDRATRAAVDLSAAGFGSVESASVQLGKALQDPVKGITALSRAGVTFTEEQKEMIKTFVEANDVASAQALVLGEVEKQVKGTGDASATESAKMSEAFGELEESAGELIAALAGGGKKKGGGLTAAIFDLSDAVSATAKSKAWGDLGADIRGTSGKIGDLTGSLLTFDKKIATTLDKLPGLRKGLISLVDPTHGLAGAFLDLADALGNVNSENQKLLDKPLESYGGGDLSDLLTRAGGGPVSSGLVKVGENGPELVQFGGSGGYVYNNSQTREMLDDASGDTYVNNFNITGPTSLAELRQQADWYNTYGTRFGS